MNPFIIVPLAMLVGGIGLIILGIKSRQVPFHYVEAEGEVIDIIYNDKGLGYPVIRLQHQGETFEIRSKTGTKPPMRKGKIVKVSFDPEKLEDMKIHSFAHSGSAYILVGAFFLFMSYLFLKAFAF